MPCYATLGKLIYARSHPILFILKMQPNALLLRQNFMIRKKWVLHPPPPEDPSMILFLIDGSTCQGNVGQGWG
jgi:hypothetical protein